MKESWVTKPIYISIRKDGRRRGRDVGSQDKADSSLSMALGDFIIEITTYDTFLESLGPGEYNRIILKMFCHYVNEHNQE